MDLALNNLQWLMCHITEPNLISFSFSKMKHVKSLTKNGTT